VRGVVGLEITVYGPARGLHSGHYGNWAPNPGILLSRLLASMKDDEGRVLVEGFYDSTIPLGPTEQAAVAAVPDVDGELLAELALARSEGTGSLAERILLPSLNVRGIRCGDVGADAQNVIPSTATASLDIRLVKGNDPEAMLDLVEAHIRKQGFFVVHEEPDATTRRAHDRVARVARGTGYPAVRTSMDDPLIAQLVRAAEAASPDPVVLMPGLGGSLPLYHFTETWDKPLVIVPIANHDDNQHAPNENLRLANLWYGIDLFAAILALPE
jgi:acetylornithine deacetylase/succinyl-diaminopimelate desuccinylase-like protein